MNETQKKIILCVGIVMLAMTTFPPFYGFWRGTSVNLGYHFLFNPPNYISQINVGILFIQYVFVCILGGIALALTKDKICHKKRFRITAKGELVGVIISTLYVLGIIIFLLLNKKANYFDLLFFIFNSLAIGWIVLLILGRLYKNKFPSHFKKSCYKEPKKMGKNNINIQSYTLRYQVPTSTYNMYISICLLAAIYLVELFNYSQSHYHINSMSYAFGALGGTLVLIIIPTFIACYAMLIKNNSFFNSLKKWLIYISIPFLLIASFGQWYGPK